MYTISGGAGVDSRTLSHCMNIRWTKAAEEQKSGSTGFLNFLRRLSICIAAISITRYVIKQLIAYFDLQ